MGKFCMCVFLLFTSLCAVAQKVDSEEAENVAASVLSKDFKPALEIVSRGSGAGGLLKQSTAFYAYNATDGDGFIIVGGDKRLPRILGYSDSGTFDYANIPPQLAYMLSHLQERVDSMPMITDRSWSSPRTEIKPEVLLPTAEWGQGAPYNEYCPTINGEKALTGCGATALAILMKYHSFPERGIGEWAYERNGVKASFDYENTTFEWDKMPMKLDETSSDDAKKAVGTLMYAAGVSLGVSYGTSESGTFHTSGDESFAMSFLFRYSPDCQYIYKKHFSDEEFVKLTREQLDSNLPVMYGGTPLDINYGHAWVVDGYTKDGNLFHCNWGWDGYLNGYYALNEMMGRFHCDGMMLNVRPASDREDPLVPKGQFDSNCLDSRCGIRIDRNNINPYETFRFSSRGFTICLSSSSSETQYSQGVAIIDENDNIKEILFDKYGIYDKNFRYKPYCPVTIGLVELTSTLEKISPTDYLQLLYSYENRNFSDKNPIKEWKFVKDAIEAPAKISVNGNEPMPIRKLKIELDNNLILLQNTDDPRQTQRELRDGDTSYFELEANPRFVLKPRIANNNYSILFNINGHSRGTFVLADNFQLTWDNYDYVGFYPSGYLKEGMFNGKYVPLSKPKIVVVDTPGTLSTIIPSDEAKTIPHLTVRGKIDARDIWKIAEEFQSLKILDLTDTEICEISLTELPWYESFSKYMTLTQHANQLPELGLTEMIRLEELYLPKSISSIGNNALCCVARLKSLVIPESVNKICEWSIRFDVNPIWGESWNNIKSITSLNPIPPETGVGTFDGVYENHVILYVPDGSVDAYRNAPGWDKFEQILPLSSGVETPEITEADNDEVEVFNIQGMRLFSGKRTDMPQLPVGIYVMRYSDGKSHKFVIR